MTKKKKKIILVHDEEVTRSTIFADLQLPPSPAPHKKIFPHHTKNPPCPARPLFTFDARTG